MNSAAYSTLAAKATLLSAIINRWNIDISPPGTKSARGTFFRRNHTRQLYSLEYPGMELFPSFSRSRTNLDQQRKDMSYSLYCHSGMHFLPSHPSQRRETQHASSPAPRFLKRERPWSTPTAPRQRRLPPSSRGIPSRLTRTFSWL